MLKRPDYQAHPWHGISPGKQFPDMLTVYIEMVPTDTVKYEIDKSSGHMIVDRPQKFSSLCPALYGFIPRTLCDEKVAEIARNATGRSDIQGDQDPLDILVITERTINQGGILVTARPIGGLRMFDGNEADDKIIAVLKNDPVYGSYKSIKDMPDSLLNRIKHYFLTYKEMPTELDTAREIEITDTYSVKEAREIIKASYDDYQNSFSEF